MDRAKPTAVPYSTLWGWLTGLLTALLWVLSIPPFDFAEAAYVAFIPMLLWFSSGPKRRLALAVSFSSGFVVWLSMLIWLRHVTLGGTISLAAILSAVHLPWFVLAQWAQPKIVTSGFAVRITGCLALAGVWVLLEWLRSWLFWGFPWAPLALSQWERPVVLQVAAWTGAYGISFLLIVFNLCVAQTLWIRATSRNRKLLTGWFSPDLYLALSLLIACIALFFKSLPDRDSACGQFSAGVVQPYISAELKWDDAREQENLETLWQMTRFVGQTECDVLLWPEAATPWPVVGNEAMCEQIESLSRELGKPVLMGNLAYLESVVSRGGADVWQNGIFLVDPDSGLSDARYAKRELVPFGEYVPEPFGFINKVVPLGGQCVRGSDPGLILLAAGGREWQVGPLVCYEDVFPVLARDSVRAGAELIFVATNNAWYGEEGCAEQHAAHSVLRAVENRRPVLRCGNGGWSGWIDAYGTIREVLRDEQGSTYFRGGGNFTVFQYEEWLRKKSYYTRHGDWFVVVCGGLAVAGVVFFWIRRRPG
ncbi:MAG: apolipoprotein N-acyltransferase [Coraliomargaritaceae bacterium]